MKSAKQNGLPSLRHKAPIPTNKWPIAHVMGFRGPTLRCERAVLNSSDVCPSADAGTGCLNRFPDFSTKPDDGIDQAPAKT